MCNEGCEAERSFRGLRRAVAKFDRIYGLGFKGLNWLEVLLEAALVADGDFSSFGSTSVRERIFRSGEVEPELLEKTSSRFESSTSLLARSNEACLSKDLRPFLPITYFSTASCMIFLSEVLWCRIGTIGGVGGVSAVKSEKLWDLRCAGGGGIDLRFFGRCAASVSSFETL